MKKLNTHFYDGQLTQRYNEIKKMLDKECLTLNQCFNEIEELIEKSNLPLNQIKIANFMLNLLKNKNGNYDSANKIHVHDLLPYVWTKVRDYDDSGKQLFLEQLIDIRGGTCPQGRVARLIQLVED